ncbi:MAG: molybdenum transporter, periplasmic molybdate-binding protein [Gemmataceae bacterium]|nr:molybdenum transporter, periplasmic molybdate-binding protein [Gemmataceae bacterium]
MRPAVLLLTCLGALGCGGPRAPEPATGSVRVAAAASVKPALEEIATAFRERNPQVEVTITYGASGAFVAQITNHAPFDLFLSADTEYPRRLVESGMASPDDSFRYATGRLVVWARHGASLPFESEGLPAVAGASVRTVAVANPRHAPYGRAAETALKAAGVWEVVRGRVVYGENVEQVANVLTTGTADVGFLPASLASAPALAGGRTWPVPPDLYPQIEQGGVVLARAADPAAAARFRIFLTGPDGRAILSRHGFDPPRE